MTHTFTSNGNVDIAWNGGVGSIVTSGSFGGGTLTIYYSIDSRATFVALDAGAVISSATEKGFGFILPSCYIRPVLTGATSPTLKLVLE